MDIWSTAGGGGGVDIKCNDPLGLGIRLGLEIRLGFDSIIDLPVFYTSSPFLSRTLLLDNKNMATRRTLFELLT